MRDHLTRAKKIDTAQRVAVFFTLMYASSKRDQFPLSLYAMSKEHREKAEVVYPIDKEKVTDSPHILPYGHHVGSAVIKATDVGKQKGRALTTMAQQTEQQLEQIYAQMKLLAEQARQIERRRAISEEIYQADFRFEPVVNHTYYLYRDEAMAPVLSMIAPNQWGKANAQKYVWVATVQLMGDHTWKVLQTDEKSDEWTAG